MSSKIITSAIVLRRQSLNEADRKIVLMTLALGKVTAFAKGVRWAKGRLTSLVEPFAEIEAHLHARPEKGIATLIGATLKTAHPGLRTRLAAWGTGFTLCEITESLSPEFLPSPAVFRLLGEALSALERGAGAAVTKLAYTVRFLKEIGYGLAEETKNWNLTPAEAALLGTLERIPFSDLPRTAGPDLQAFAHLEKRLSRFLEDYLPRPLLSPSVQDSLRKAGEPVNI